MKWSEGMREQDTFLPAHSISTLSTLKGASFNHSPAHLDYTLKSTLYSVLVPGEFLKLISWQEQEAALELETVLCNKTSKLVGYQSCQGKI